MKKTVSILLCVVMAFSLLTACTGKKASGNAASAAQSTDAGDPFKIVTTIFPVYDWVREVLGEKAEHAELIMLLDNGVDLHNYQPTVDDIIEISACDIFLYVGGESDEWVEDALAESVNPDMQVINLLEALGDQVKEEEVVEGL